MAANRNVNILLRKIRWLHLQASEEVRAFASQPETQTFCKGRKQALEDVYQIVLDLKLTTTKLNKG